MAGALDATYGVALVTLFLATILYGMGLIQVYLYFHWYSKDHLILKIVVVCLVILETLQIVFFFDGMYLNLIDNFGNPGALDVIFWQDSAQLLCGYLSAFLVQMYFGYCVHALTPGNKFVPGVIILLGIASLGSAIAQTIRTTNSMISALVITAVNRGVLTALCATLNMVLFLAQPNTFYFFLGLIPSGKLYMNSMLATLNTRE
ncbi:hypothetical protein C8R46DRAFT_1221503 [Mycena filopes]|nr:hypothetical protein C8R46DRAFT_1221503 [Mycena filopes]